MLKFISFHPKLAAALDAFLAWCWFGGWPALTLGGF